jgi:hypothetical protein
MRKSAANGHAENAGCSGADDPRGMAAAPGIVRMQKSSGGR